MIIEGRNAVNEALKADITIEKVMVQKDRGHSLDRIVSECKKRKIKITFVDKSVLAKYSESKNNQGIIAFTTDFKYSQVEEIIANNEADNRKLIILLDGIEDPHNLGAIIRIADSVNANGIIISKHRSCGVTETAVKVSAGAAAHVKIAKVTNLNDTIRWLKDMGIRIFAADMEGESAYRCDLKDDLALIIGGEGKGVHQLTKKLADKIISLPQLGKINSLNASVAAGAILYECIRQRYE
ncbi:MAG: 23S rRNA (guanosine(2251)-2'-O)-methyltransferase RlmB [Christensenellales bacterium]|jgi:23S rRNA (guanosine2251-2'-O)-methyltransferase|nr:23S rRNA (guanosine(2251)-2'-O)-methyltransferase RlmB [Clostridiales bacterium]